MAHRARRRRASPTSTPAPRTAGPMSHGLIKAAERPTTPSVAEKSPAPQQTSTANGSRTMPVTVEASRDCCLVAIGLTSPLPMGGTLDASKVRLRPCRRSSCASRQLWKSRPSMPCLKAPRFNRKAWLRPRNRRTRPLPGPGSRSPRLVYQRLAGQSVWPRLWRPPSSRGGRQ